MAFKLAKAVVFSFQGTTRSVTLGPCSKNVLWNWDHEHTRSSKPCVGVHPRNSKSCPSLWLCMPCILHVFYENASWLQGRMSRNQVWELAIHHSGRHHSRQFGDRSAMHIQTDPNPKSMLPPLERHICQPAEFHQGKQHCRPEFQLHGACWPRRQCNFGN